MTNDKLKELKHRWYVKNRERLINKSRQYYKKKKKKIKTTTFEKRPVLLFFN